jgi:hypothetical protein
VLSVALLSVVVLSVVMMCFVDPGCHLCRVSFLLSVAFFIDTLNVIVTRVFLLNVVARFTATLILVNFMAKHYSPFWFTFSFLLHSAFINVYLGQFYKTFLAVILTFVE